MDISKNQELLLALIGTPSEVQYETLAAMDISEWNELFLLSARQGLFALVYDQLNLLNFKLPAPKEILIKWELSVIRLEKRYERQKGALKELVFLFNKNNIDCLLLKGIGLSLLYPVPEHRECGDIDIYLFGEHDRGNDIIEKLGIEIDKTGQKHSNFYYQGIPVENHKSFLNIKQHRTDKIFEKKLHWLISENFQTVEIDDFSIRIPSPDFNAIFLTRHAITHFLATGLVLRHICDLAFFFEQNYDRINLSEFRRLLKNENLFDVFCSLLKIARDYLGMEERIFYSVTGINSDCCDEELTIKILKDTLENKYRTLSKEKRASMKWFNGKYFSFKCLLDSKWRYDAIRSSQFYRNFIYRVRLNLAMLLKK